MEMTQEEFYDILQDLVSACSASTLLSIPGIYEVLCEHFNNEVIERWEDKQL